MIVNVFINRKGDLLDTLVDESTAYRLGDIISLKGDEIPKIIIEIKTKECYDYNTIVYVNCIDDHSNSVDDVVVEELEGEFRDELQTDRGQSPDQEG